MYYLKDGRTAFVGKGFNWFAFVFVWGWLFSRGLWKHGILMMLIYIPVYFISSSLNLTFMDGIKQDELYYLAPLVFILLMHLLVGIKGNQWREHSLLEQGYKKVQ